MRCPICGYETEVKRTPHTFRFGDVIELSYSCDKCDFKFSDIVSIIKHQENCEFYINAPEKLNTRIVKSKNCIIEIPELGIKIKPGDDKQAYVIDLNTLIDKIKVLLETRNVPEKDYAISKLNAVKTGDFAITISLHDKEKNSVIGI